MTTIVLWVEDLPLASNFYCNLLAADAVDVSNEFVRVTSAQNEVLLHAVPEKYRVGLPDVARAREEAVIKPVFSIDSIDRARQAVVENGGVVYGVDKENRYGSTTYCDGFDPEGNVFQLAQR